MDYANNTSLFNETSISPALVSQVGRAKLHPTAREAKEQEEGQEEEEEDEDEDEDGSG